MLHPTQNNSDHYTDLVARQIEQYKETELGPPSH